MRGGLDAVKNKTKCNVLPGQEDKKMPVGHNLDFRSPVAR